MHADCYKIDWASERIIYTGRTNDSKLIGYASSYSIYTELHSEDECGLYMPDTNWPVVGPPLKES